MSRRTLEDIPTLRGRTVVVTGGNTGLGFRSVRELARRGARVFFSSRSAAKAQAAAGVILPDLPGARVEGFAMDLTDPASVERFAGRVASRTDRLDILLNNAGVVNLAELERTPLGHEMHMATNHYGHFLLTGHLFGLLAATSGARVVTVTSGAYRAGVIDFDDLDWSRRPYSRSKAYGDSKLANLLFARELQRRFDAAGAAALSLAAHPGLTGTERQQSVGIGGRLARLLAAPIHVGVRPQLRAATDPSAGKLDFFGPRFGLRGPARRIPVRGPARSDDLARRLWKVTAKVTGFRYPTAARRTE